MICPWKKNTKGNCEFGGIKKSVIKSLLPVKIHIWTNYTIIWNYTDLEGFKALSRDLKRKSPGNCPEKLSGP